MKRNIGKGIRRYEAAPSYRISRQALVRNGIKLSDGKRDGGVGTIYVGPSVDGTDKEYVKVLSGEVDRRKPSFV